MVFDADGVITAVPFDQIARIEKSSHRLRNGALAGLISGAGLGLGIWAGACSESCDGEEAVAWCSRRACGQAWVRGRASASGHW